LADAFFPKEPRTISTNITLTGHDGVFLVSSNLVDRYIKKFVPQVLRLDKRTACEHYEAKNMGDSKGLTFDRVLIFPHKAGQKWLSTGDYKHVEGSIAKLYVGTTRARFSVAFVFDGETRVTGLVRYC
jgi:DNA helicase II / ATP-dependent DNA helicase PcrA